jgi:hypothetical protein
VGCTVLVLVNCELLTNESKKYLLGCNRMHYTQMKAISGCYHGIFIDGPKKTIKKLRTISIPAEI